MAVASAGFQCPRSRRPQEGREIRDRQLLQPPALAAISRSLIVGIVPAGHRAGRCGCGFAPCTCSPRARRACPVLQLGRRLRDDPPMHAWRVAAQADSQAMIERDRRSASSAPRGRGSRSTTRYIGGERTGEGAGALAGAAAPPFIIAVKTSAGWAAAAHPPPGRARLPGRRNQAAMRPWSSPEPPSSAIGGQWLPACIAESAPGIVHERHWVTGSRIAPPRAILPSAGPTTMLAISRTASLRPSGWSPPNICRRYLRRLRLAVQPTLRR